MLSTVLRISWKLRIVKLPISGGNDSDLFCKECMLFPFVFFSLSVSKIWSPGKYPVSTTYSMAKSVDGAIHTLSAIKYSSIILSGSSISHFRNVLAVTYIAPSTYVFFVPHFGQVFIYQRAIGAPGHLASADCRKGKKVKLCTRMTTCGIPQCDSLSRHVKRQKRVHINAIEMSAPPVRPMLMNDMPAVFKQRQISAYIT